MPQRGHADAHTLLEKEERAGVGAQPMLVLGAVLRIAAREQVLARRELETVERLAARLADGCAVEQHVQTGHLADECVAKDVRAKPMMKAVTATRTMIRSPFTRTSWT